MHFCILPKRVSASSQNAFHSPRNLELTETVPSMLPRAHIVNCLRARLEENDFANKPKYGGAVEGRLAEASQKNRGSAMARGGRLMRPCPCA